MGMEDLKEALEDLVEDIRDRDEDEGEDEGENEAKKKSLLAILLSWGKVGKIILAIIALLVVIAVLCIVIFAPSGKTTYSAVSSLKEVFEISEFSTAEYTYNSIVRVKIDPEKPEDEKNIKYYVQYNGTVWAGFDFKKVEVIEKDNTITVVVPRVEIQRVTVDPVLEYIFTKEKYNTETTYVEATAACNEHLKEAAAKNVTFNKMVIEGAVDTVKALTKPFESALEEGQTLQVVYADDYVPEVEE